jgi:RES domain-containing protein
MASPVRRLEKIFRTLGEQHRGSFVRAVPLEYQNSPLSAVGSLGGGRYNRAGTFEMLYLGENADTIARETRLIVLDKDGNDAARPQPPKIIMTVKYELQRVTDLTNPDILELLGVDASSLILEWTHIVKAGRTPFTQHIGAAAAAVGLEGLIVPSMRHAGKTNVNVIKDNMLVGSAVWIHEPVGFAPSVPTRIDGTR